jgi:hypothetical protein
MNKYEPTFLIPVQEDLYKILQSGFDEAVQAGTYSPDQFNQYVNETLMYGLVCVGKIQAGQVNPEVFHDLSGLEIINKHELCMN